MFLFDIKGMLIMMISVPST